MTNRSATTVEIYLKSFQRRWLSLFMLLCLLTGAILTLEIHSHLIFNPSASEPKGWYWITDEPPSRNGLVLLRNPLKRLVAQAGDTVTWSPNGVLVNNRLIPKSAVPVASPYPHYPYGTVKLEENQYVVMGDNPLSWDSRYEGPIPGILIATTVKPLWTK